MTYVPAFCPSMQRAVHPLSPPPYHFEIVAQVSPCLSNLRIIYYLYSIYMDIHIVIRITYLLRHIQRRYNYMHWSSMTPRSLSFRLLLFLYFQCWNLDNHWNSNFDECSNPSLQTDSLNYDSLYEWYYMTHTWQIWEIVVVITTADATRFVTILLTFTMPTE